MAGEGHRALLLWTLSANPSCTSYAGLGGEAVPGEPVTIGGAMLETIAYRWGDIASLIQRRSQS